jgi:uncharacterized protein YjiS (DUF1127 family)
VPVFSEIGPVNLLNNTLLVWAQHRAFRAVYAELTRHSDRELRDRGLARGDLAAIAYAEAERRIITPAPNRAEAASLAWHDPAPARGAAPCFRKFQDGGAR